MSTLKNQIKFVDCNYDSPKQLLTEKQLNKIMDMAHNQKRLELDIIREAVDIYLFTSKEYVAVRLKKWWSKTWNRIKRIFTSMLSLLFHLIIYGVFLIVTITYPFYYHCSKVYYHTYGEEQMISDLEAFATKNKITFPDTTISIIISDIQQKPGQANEK